MTVLPGYQISLTYCTNIAMLYSMSMGQALPHQQWMHALKWNFNTFSNLYFHQQINEM